MSTKIELKVLARMPHLVAVFLLTSTSTSSWYLRVSAFQSPATELLRQRGMIQPKIHHAPYADSSTSRVESAAAGAGASSFRLHGVVEAWDAYNTALEADPLIVKSLTAFVILGAADLAGQAFEKQQRDEGGKEEEAAGDGIDWARSARFAIFGLVLQAPWNH